MLTQSMFLAAALLLPSASAHIALFHPSMYGYNVSGNTVTSVPGDNRPVYPLMGRTFAQWWFHGHMDFPPHPNDIFQLPVGQSQVVELACDKGATSYWPISDGSSNLQLTGGDGNSPCPGQPLSQYHTNGIDDLGGCALAVAYTSDAASVKPDDFVVFSIQHTCVWTKDTYFDIPAAMPPCPDGKCLCSFNWIHKPDSGSEQMFLNMFQCNFKGATGTKAVAKGNVPRRCGADPANGKMEAVPSNCTVGAKTPMYWYQLEGNNMFEGTYAPPLYTDLYGFAQGAQNDIFEGSASTPTNSATVTTSKAAAVTTSQAAAVTTSKAAAVTTSEAAAVTTSKAAAATTSQAAAVTTSKATYVDPGSSAAPASSAAPVSSADPSTSKAAATTTVKASSVFASASAAPVNNVGGGTTSAAAAATTSSVFVADPSASPEVSVTASASSTKSASAASTAKPSKPTRVCKPHKGKRPTLADLAHAKKVKAAARKAKDASVKRTVSASSRKHHARRAAAAELLL